MVPATVTRPPAKALMTGDVSEPSAPDSRLPTWVPPAATMKSVAITRPRMCSGVTVATIVLRNTMVSASAAPATASAPSVGHRPRTSANAANAAPVTATVHSIARPCLTMCLTGPENDMVTMVPTPKDARNKPSVRGLPPNRSALMAGNSTTGKANTDTLRSARKAQASTWWRRMNANPSATARRPPWLAPDAAGAAGSLAIPYSAAVNVSVSIR
jgi:hypothetical protein